MVYEVPKSKRSLKQNQFQFQFPGDKTVYAVPLMQYMAPDLALKLNELSVSDEVEAFKLLIVETLPEGTWEKFEDVEQLMAFIEAWKEASTVSVGESLGSPE